MDLGVAMNPLTLYAKGHRQVHFCGAKAHSFYEIHKGISAAVVEMTSQGVFGKA